MGKDEPSKITVPKLSREDQEKLRKHVKLNKGGGIIEIEPGDAVVVFRHDRDVTSMPDVVIPLEGGRDDIARVNACKVLYTLMQLNNGDSLRSFGDTMEEAWRDFSQTVSDTDLDNIVKYEAIAPGFISPGSDEIH